MYQTPGHNQTMPPKGTDRIKPPHGQRIEERRKELGITYDNFPEITERQGKKLYRQWLYRIEWGEKLPEKLNPTEIDILARTLQWSQSQLEEALGVKWPIDGGDEGDALTRSTIDETLHETYPVYASAAAGSDSYGEPLDGEYVVISGDERRRLGASEPGSIRAIKVNGDCLVSRKASAEKRGIRHGDILLVDINAPIMHGHLGLFYDQQDDVLIVKYAFEGEEQGEETIVLEDANGPVAIRKKSDPELYPIGRVWYKQGRVD